MYQCPLSGNFCFNHKNILAYKIVNGHPMQLSLCSDCINVSEPNDLIWQKFLQTIFHLLGINRIISEEEYNKAVLTIKNKDQLNEFLETLARKKRNIDFTACPGCGMQLQNIIDGERLGCAKCYEHFSEFLTKLLKRVQDGATNHQGKKPHNTINNLQKEMDLAIQEERYEDAAKLRDQIKVLKGPIPPTSQAE